MNSSVLCVIAVVAITTIIIRFLPFVLFKKKTPAIIDYLGSLLPYAIMAMLVVYCLKDTPIFSDSHGLREGIAALSVVMIHKLKHNTLLSIVSGTVLYMILIRII